MRKYFLNQNLLLVLIIERCYFCEAQSEYCTKYHKNIHFAVELLAF